MNTRLISAIALAALAGCDLDFSINCSAMGSLSHGSWYCSDQVADGGQDSGIDASVQNNDASVSPGQSDSGDARDSGQDASTSDASEGGLSDAGRDAQVADAGYDSSVRSDAGGQNVSDGGVFRVHGAKLYDANGNEFRIRGTNKVHIDSWTPYLAQMPSNTTRWNAYFWNDAQGTVNSITSPNIGGTTANGKDVAIVGWWWLGQDANGNGRELTCKSDVSLLNASFDNIIANVATFNTVKRYLIINPANEWGDSAIAWRNAYVSNIPRLRAAGWHGTVLVDAPGCGQNATAVINYGKDILAADPDKNVALSVHAYGLFFDSQNGIARQYQEQLDLVPTFDALAATGLAVVIGEFGPGRNIGPSPTLITPERIVSLAEQRGFGWLTWAADDWDGPNESSSEQWFGHIKQGWTYNSDADLTAWGRQAKALWLLYQAQTASVLQ